MCANFSVTTRQDGRVFVLAVMGDLDITTAPGLTAALAAARASEAERLVLDLAGVQFMDCAGATVIVRAGHGYEASCPVIVRSLSPAVRRLFELLSLNSGGIAGRSGTARLHGGPDPRSWWLIRMRPVRRLLAGIAR